MIPLASPSRTVHDNPFMTMSPTLDYEQQRRHLLHKHGIDLEESGMDGNKTRRMDRKDVAMLMGGDGQSGVFTWREKHRRKVPEPFLWCGAHLTQPKLTYSLRTRCKLTRSLPRVLCADGRCPPGAARTHIVS